VNTGGTLLAAGDVMEAHSQKRSLPSQSGVCCLDFAGDFTRDSFAFPFFEIMFLSDFLRGEALLGVA